MSKPITILGGINFGDTREPDGYRGFYFNINRNLASGKIECVRLTRDDVHKIIATAGVTLARLDTHFVVGPPPISEDEMRKRLRAMGFPA